MRVAILGAGAMGSVFGAHLALAGHDVALVDTRRDHIDAVRRDGLVLEGGPQVRRVMLTATTDPFELEPVDLVIVLTKSYATEEAARALNPATGPQTWVVTLQNGLGNDRRLAAVFGPEQVVPGTTTVGAQQEGPGMTRMSASTARRDTMTYLAPPRTGAHAAETVNDIAQTLTEAGLPAQVLDSADEVIWTKLALAAPMGCLSALLHRCVIDVFETPSSRQVLRDLFDEVVAVAAAHGVHLDQEATWAHAEHTFRSVGPHATSMAADVLAGRRTEIEALCLEVVRLGEERAVATPVNRTVGLAILAMEATYDRALTPP